MKLRIAHVLLFSIVALLTTSNVSAQLRRAGKMSGPGPYVGFGVFYPVPLFRTQYPEDSEVGELTARDVQTLRDLYGIRLPALAFLKRYFDSSRRGADPIEITRRERVMFESFGFRVPPVPEFPEGQPRRDWANEELANIWRFFQEEDEIREPTAAQLDETRDMLQDWTRFLRSHETIFFAQINEQIGKKPLRPGGFGIFGTKKASRGYIPRERANPWFNLTFDFLRSIDNDLTYRRFDARSKTVWWLSLYPSIEGRWPFPCTRHLDLVVNGGVALNYIVGDTFDNFSRGSARARAGLRYKALWFGVQADYFWDRFNPSDFQAVGESRDGGEWITGLFVNVAVPGFN